MPTTASGSLMQTDSTCLGTYLDGSCGVRKQTVKGFKVWRMWWDDCGIRLEKARTAGRRPKMAASPIFSPCF